MTNLDTIVILYRRPDTLTLYGIPYDMRPGQSPKDIWDGPMYNPDHPNRRTVAVDKQLFAPPREWIWLGQPGWWGHFTRDGIELVKAWLDAHKDDIPNGPNEWSRVTKEKTP